MQVSHVEDHITHAVIGGGQTIEFGVSSSAQLMHILSTSLYSNQRLAVAREVLCNSWDAHIRAGLTHIPIEVTITNAYITVRDRAVGIAPNMMGPLAGTYGGTDKLNNGSETGGFGFGFKAPFSYTEHFEVTSWHQGTKTIYNLAKSSADKNGKPGITPIVSVPTTESGLQVKIPVKSGTDDSITFLELFRQVAHNGEMNVLINGSSVEGLPLSKGMSNWLITKKSILNRSERIYIRYGNVIYPVEKNTHFQWEYGAVISFIDQLQSEYQSKTYKIVFQALPNTISVTPSRESLSMQDHTIQTIKGLLVAFLNEKLESQIPENSLTILDQKIAKAITDRNIGGLMQCTAKMINTPRNDTYHPNFASEDISYISNMIDIATQYTSHTYPKTPSFYKRDMGLRIDGAISLGIGHRGHLEKVKKKLIEPKHRWKSCMHMGKPSKMKISFDPYLWFKKTIIRPLVRDIEADPVMDWKKLFIMNMPNSSEQLMEPIYYKKQAIEEYLPILRKVVVLTYSKKDIWIKVKTDKEIMKYGDAYNIWIYHSPVSSKKIQATRDFFIKRGFVLIDYTSEENWASHKVKRHMLPKAERVVKPKLTGYAALSGVYSVDSTVRVDSCFKEGAPRLTAPLFYHQIEFSRAEVRQFSLGAFNRDDSILIAKMFGNVCAVVRTTPQANKLKELGLVELNKYVIDYVCDKVTNSPSFQAYWPECVCRGLGSKLGNSGNSLSKILFDIPEVRTIMGLTTSLDSHDLMVLALWRSIIGNRYVYDHDGKVQAAKTAIEAIPVTPTLTDIATKISTSGFSDLLNLSAIENIVRRSKDKIDGSLHRLAKLTQALLG